ncbi:MAG: hypothetical protein LBI10_11630, partial [Deltaproteobacteria bacterium]|nr:hypothetical protein [Deltaproteobacteria bacterium]
YRKRFWLSLQMVKYIVSKTVKASFFVTAKIKNIFWAWYNSKIRGANSKIWRANSKILGANLKILGAN